MRKSLKNNQKAFTLIELLVVIVIIGILAGVLIAVINPFRQQNRAKNGTVKATIQKLAFAVNTARAGMGVLPDETQLDTELDNITVSSARCGTEDELNCTFNVSGINLPATCGGDYVSGTGENQCEFGIYSSDIEGGSFRVAAKIFKLTSDDASEETGNNIYVFDSSDGLFNCDAGVTWTTVDLSGCVAE